MKYKKGDIIDYEIQLKDKSIFEGSAGTGQLEISQEVSTTKLKEKISMDFMLQLADEHLGVVIAICDICGIDPSDQSQSYKMLYKKLRKLLKINIAKIEDEESVSNINKAFNQ